MLGTALDNQPAQTDVRPVLDDLIDAADGGLHGRDVRRDLHAQRRQGRVLGGALERRRATRSGLERKTAMKKRKRVTRTRR